MKDEATHGVRRSIPVPPSDIESRFGAALLDIALDAISVLDARYRIVYWNKGATNVYGWSADEALGRDAIELLAAPSNAAEHRRAIEMLLHEGEWSGDLRERTKDGVALIVSARWSLIRDASGEPSGVLSVCTDVTTQRSVSEQLYRAQRLDSLGTLAGGVAHDLNNMLTPIVMGTGELLGSEQDPKKRELISIIHACAMRGANIVAQILGFVRGMEGNRVEFQVRHLLAESESLIRGTFPRSINVTMKLAKELWTVLGNPTQLQQVVMNLCVNARDAMPNGGHLQITAANAQLTEEHARAHVGARAIRYLLITVEDDGEGMSEEVRERIFDPFYTTKGVGRGTGLGLSTALAIVKGHGGFITVHSEVGRGSMFGVYLPALQQDAPAFPEELIWAAPEGKGELVLVVDDEPNVRAMAESVLKAHGYRALAAADGMEGLTTFVEHRSDVKVIIADTSMPELDGATMLRIMRRIDDRVGLIVASGLAPQERTVESVEPDARIAKPFSAELLLSTIREVIEARFPEAETDS